MALIGEQGLETLGLGIGEQAGPGQQGAPGLVEPDTRPAPPAHDCPSLGQLLTGGAVEPGETTPWPPPERLVSKARPGRRARS